MLSLGAQNHGSDVIALIYLANDICEIINQTSVKEIIRWPLNFNGRNEIIDGYSDIIQV